MADVVNSEGITPVNQSAESSRWAFLKNGVNKGLSKVKNMVHRRETSGKPKPEPQIAETPKTPDNGKKDQPEETLEQKAAKIGVDIRLYRDFIKYLQDPSKVKDPELAKRAERALNDGDIEVIATLANIIESEYENDLKQSGPNLTERQLLTKQKNKGLNTEEQQVLSEIQMNKPGYKKALARQLGYSMSYRVKQEKGRDSVGGAMDLKLALSPNKDTLMKKLPTEGERMANLADELVRQIPPSSTPKS